MAKTAEEIAKKWGFDSDSDAIEAMREFAAQEVEAYKQRVYREVSLMRSSIQEIGHWEEGYSEAIKDTMKIIDTVK